MSARKQALIAVLVALLAGCSDDSSFPTGRAAVALYRVYRSSPAVLEFSDETSDRDFDVVRNTQIGLLRSHFVIEAAIRPAEVAEIPQIAQAEDAIEWVKERIHARFPGNGEIMEVSVFDENLSDDELTTLTDSLCDAYMREVVEGERIDRLRLQDVLREQLVRVTDELARLRQKHAQLADGLGRRGNPFRQARIDMLVNQHRDVKTERRALARKTTQPALADAGHHVAGSPPDDRESEQEAGATPPPTDAGPTAEAVPSRELLQTQLDTLDAEAEALEAELDHLSRRAADLATLEDEIQSYEQLTDEIRIRLLIWEIEATAGSRVKPIQSAVITHFDDEDD